MDHREELSHSIWGDSGPWITHLPTLWARLRDVCGGFEGSPWIPPPYPGVPGGTGYYNEGQLTAEARDELAAWWEPALHLLRYGLGCQAPVAALTRHLDRRSGADAHPNDAAIDHAGHPAWAILDAWWGQRLTGLASWGLLEHLDASLGGGPARYGTLSRRPYAELEELARAQYLRCDGGGDVLHLSGHLGAPELDGDLEAVEVVWPDETDDDQIEVQASSYAGWYAALRAFVHGTRYARVLIAGIGEVGTFRSNGGAPFIATVDAPTSTTAPGSSIDIKATGDASGLKAGSLMETAMLSPVVAGHLRTWIARGSQLWRVDDPTGLADLLGRGLTARSEVEAERYREVGLLDSHSGTLLVPKRFTVGGDVETTAFTLTPVTDEPDPDRQWLDFVAWLNASALSAAERGDFLVVELGGWNHQPHPYALFAHTRVSEESFSHLEVAPSPTSGIEPWAMAGGGVDGATVTAPATAETVGVAGSALAPAIREWGRSPLELAVTFGIHPDGPIHFGAGATQSATGVATSHDGGPHATSSDGSSSTIPDPGPASERPNAAPLAVESFSPFVQEQIGWYVYLLRDPRDGQVFYVGKGTGDRVFQHAQDAATLQDSQKPKLGRIHAIRAAGLQVITELVRHHIPTEKAAYLVEAAVIDAMCAVGVELANEVQGHHSALYGWANTAVAASVYEATPFPDVDEALVMFKIPKLWTPAMRDADLYEVTRGWWVLGPKARRARYALAVHKGVTRGAWRIDYWRERVAGDRDYDRDEAPPRVGFAGTKAPEMAHLLNRSVKHLPQGAGAVTIYLNCAETLPMAELLTGTSAIAAAAQESPGV